MFIKLGILSIRVQLKSLLLCAEEWDTHSRDPVRGNAGATPFLHKVARSKPLIRKGRMEQPNDNPRARITKNSKRENNSRNTMGKKEKSTSKTKSAKGACMVLIL